MFLKAIAAINQRLIVRIVSQFSTTPLSEMLDPIAEYYLARRSLVEEAMTELGMSEKAFERLWLRGMLHLYD